MAQPPPPVPPFDHIFIVIMENHGYDEIIGSPDAPFINQLAARYGVAANYVSVAHPSLPNYLALGSLARSRYCSLPRRGPSSGPCW